MIKKLADGTEIRECVLSCVYNKNVNCDLPHRCDKCGWNPIVEAKRKARLRGNEV